jgi:hypothetical protein
LGTIATGTLAEDRAKWLRGILDEGFGTIGDGSGREFWGLKKRLVERPAKQGFTGVKKIIFI